jgi:hypothetical protein
MVSLTRKVSIFALLRKNICLRILSPISRIPVTNSSICTMNSYVSCTSNSNEVTLPSPRPINKLIFACPPSKATVLSIPLVCVGASRRLVCCCIQSSDRQKAICKREQVCLCLVGGDDAAWTEARCGRVYLGTSWLGCHNCMRWSAAEAM